MPLYDYVCAACGRRFEVIHGVHADPPTACPLCGSGPVRKAIAAPAVHFKGSGWAKKERRAGVTSTGPKDPGEGSADDGAGAKTSGDTDSGAAASGSTTSASGGTSSASGGGSTGSSPKPASSGD
ncbi:MAG TPA: FmdB family zinc ribbon protein [Candidatus Limnocylindrales bacterium]|nr:FmdB family zinc ribbon protein [Candidatus Limnocylindrales bacterium]